MLQVWDKLLEKLKRPISTNFFQQWITLKCLAFKLSLKNECSQSFIYFMNHSFMFDQLKISFIRQGADGPCYWLKWQLPIHSKTSTSFFRSMNGEIRLVNIIIKWQLGLQPKFLLSYFCIVVRLTVCMNFLYLLMYITQVIYYFLLLCEKFSFVLDL